MEPVSAAAAIKQLGSLVSVVIDRLEEAENIVRSSPSLREWLKRLQQTLESVADTNTRCIQIIGNDGRDSDQRLKAYLSACRKPCQEINDILIAIKTARVSSKLKAVQESKNLKLQKRKLESATQDLRFFTEDIGYDNPFRILFQPL